ncbi:metal ABC transporter solute-binding protein, Zn/Mn family [Sulfitobacter aestuariivivens]|uniref:Zinc ABC transporter substrate-binding protein n=2 Tax=Sulfitobacter aestuariivivens TaxID=2766981 RepID=A0A927D5V5_9RHOB|nr:zinc ABC transporter substrate-binding protein [Sulfitobacter aestuariivivens]
MHEKPFSLTRRAALAGGVAAVVVAPFAQAADRLSVIATTGMIADTARRIGGALVDVRGLMGPGVDPHGYRQTRSDIVAMTRADLVLWHGLYLEAQMEDFLGDLARKQPVIALADQLQADQLLGHEDYDGRFDPHVWMDPVLWKDIASFTAAAISGVRPDQAKVIAANLDAYHVELDALATYAHATLAMVPDEQRVLLTAHDAFGYFGAAYDFEVIGIQGISTESEAGLNRISTLVDELVARKIRAVFVETSVSDRNIRALIEGAAAQGHEVTIGGALYSDAMGPEGTYEGTYIGMIDHNVTTIASALGAEIDPRGMAGKLAGAS